MSSPNKRITLSFSVPSGGDRDKTATSIPRSAQTPMSATVHHLKKETMRPTHEARPKTFMDNWVEPPLRPPQPSFTDYPHLRIERYGVLEGMEPLGTMPPAKAKKLVKQNERSRSSANPEDSDASTVAVTPREMLTPEPPTNTIKRRSYSRDVDNAEWNPQPTPSRRMSAPKTPQARGPAARPSESPAAKREERHMEQTDKAVQFAVEDAILNRRWPTAYALRTLYNEHKINPRIQRLFMLVFLGKANEDERKEFRTMITWKKKQGAKNHTAQRYFDQNDNIYAPTPFLPTFNPRASTKDKAEATDRGASTSTPTSPHKQDTTTHAHKKPKVTHDDPIMQQTSYKQLIFKGKSTTDGFLKTKGSPSQRQHGRNHVTQSPRRESHSEIIQAGNMGAEKSVLERPRAASISSSSSLSSLDEAILGDLESPAKPADLRLNEAAKAKEVRERKAANSAEKPGHDHSQRPPITRHDGHVHATNNFTAVTSPSSSNTPTPNAPGCSSTNLHHNGANGMRPQSAGPYSLPPPLPSTLQFRPNLKSHKKTAAAIAAAAKKTRSYSPRDADIIRNKKKLVSQAEKEYQEAREPSFVRTPVSIPEPESGSEVADTTTVAPAQPPQIKPILRFKPRAAGDDSDAQSSPSRLTFKLDFEWESAKNSRASTPTGASRASRKSRNPGPRMKSSPKKKSLGPLAGISRENHDRQYSPSTGEHGQQDDNDDFCSSCRGSGDLVCCDGCTRSFHLRCVDPPMDQKDLPDEWFCNVCVSQRKGVTARTGLFGKLITQLEKKNPSAFMLPLHIREHFEGVRTGPGGEYEDGPPPKKGKHEEQDLFRLFDKKGEPVLCHVCSQGSGGVKPIITCSYCGLSWHLDCLDPPLANAPGNGPLRPWRCPCHVDDVIGLLGNSQRFRFRKIKGKPPIRPEFARGVKNEGHIEVELALSDNENEGFVEEREFGRNYLLPEEGIKLDFISRVHEKRREEGKEDQEMPETASQVPARPPTPPLMMDEHTLEEQQAALNLAALCNGRDTGDNNLKALTNAMVAGISGTGAIELIAKGAAAKLVKSGDDANDADVAMLDLAIEMGKQAELIRQKIEDKKQKALTAKPKDYKKTNGDVDMAEASSSSPAPPPTPVDEALAPRDDNLETEKKRKLGGKDGFLDAEEAENRDRAKRSRSR